MAAKAIAAGLHLLSARQVHAAKDGDHSDDGGLMLRVNAGRVSWMLRYTAPSGRRREMGAERDSLALAGKALTSARGLVHDARELVRHTPQCLLQIGLRRGHRPPVSMNSRDPP